MTRYVVPTACAAVLLASVLAWEWTVPDDVPDLQPPTLPAGIDARPRPATARPGGTDNAPSKALLGRPLFAPTRRPDPPPKALVVATEPASQPPRLAGILRGPALRRAMFAGPGSSGRGTIASEGDQLGEFIVLQIEPDAVRLLGPDGTDRLVPLVADPVRRVANIVAVPVAAAPARPSPGVLDVLRTIPGETTRLGPPGGPVPVRSAR